MLGGGSKHRKRIRLSTVGRVVQVSVPSPIIDLECLVEDQTIRTNSVGSLQEASRPELEPSLTFPRKSKFTHSADPSHNNSFDAPAVSQTDMNSRILVCGVLLCVLASTVQAGQSAAAPATASAAKPWRCALSVQQLVENAPEESVAAVRRACECKEATAWCLFA
jgi:hypothetical protein